MVHDPLSPSRALRTRTGAVLAALSLFVMVYSLAIVGRALIGVVFAGVISVGTYLTYRLLVVLDSIADAAQRFAAVREREADEVGGASRFERPADRE